MPYIFGWNSNAIYLRLTMTHYKYFKEKILIKKQITSKVPKFLNFCKCLFKFFKFGKEKDYE